MNSPTAIPLARPATIFRESVHRFVCGSEATAVVVAVTVVTVRGAASSEPRLPRLRRLHAQPPVQPRGDSEPTADEDYIERGERSDAERELNTQVDDARLQHVAGALAERVDRLLGLVLRFAAGRQPQRLPRRVAERVVEAVL